MTLYIAVDGATPEALDAADDELVAETVHRLLHEEVMVRGIETVGIVENLEDEIERAVISKESLQLLADEAGQTLDGPDHNPDYRATLSDAVNEAYDTLHGNGDDND